MLGYAYSRAAQTAGRAKQFRELTENTTMSYRNAADLFKQVKNKPKELECEELAFYGTVFRSTSLIDTKEAISKAMDLLIQSNKFYEDIGDEESIARTLSRAAFLSRLLINYSSTQDEVLERSQQGLDLSIKARKISKKVKHFQYFAETLNSEVSLVEQTFEKKNREEGRRLFLKCEKYLKFVEDSQDYYILALVNFAVGTCYGRFGTDFAKSEREKSEYYDKSISFLEKSEEFARKSMDNIYITQSISNLNFILLESGKYDYLAKRASQDFSYFTKLSRIFANSINPLNVLTNIYFAFAFQTLDNNISTSPESRLINIENGIKFALKGLENTSFTPTCMLLYWLLADFYSRLSFNVRTKEEQDKYIKKIFEIVKKAEQISKDYADGYSTNLPPHYYYNSIFAILYNTQARSTEKKEEKLEFSKKYVDFGENALRAGPPNPNSSMILKFGLGVNYVEISFLTNENSLLRKGKELFMEVINQSLKVGNTWLLLGAYRNIANIDDRNGNYLAAAENWKKAQTAYIEMAKSTGVSTDIVNSVIKHYEADIIEERAKAYHKAEDHLKAKECYLEISEIVEELTFFPHMPYWGPYNKAWAFLEEAEFLSKQERLEEAINVYERAKIEFQNTISKVNQAPEQIKKKLSMDFANFVKKLAKTRIDYCSARIDLEKARILGKKGEHIMAAEVFETTSSQFRKLCEVYKIAREHRELEAIYHLCKAWEQMELAEEYLEPDRFTRAADQFTKASNFSTENKYKLLASGNSAYCLALEHGCEFDKAYDINIKAQLYPRIKSILRNAASLYEKGGFKGARDWVLATSTYFDAAWHLIKADELLEIKEKKKILGIASRYLKSASELFSKSGYHDKEKEILECLERVKREEEIHISALNSIEKPAESISTAGIGAPACPLESRKKPKIEDIQRITQRMTRETRVVTIDKEVKKSLDTGHDIFICYSSKDKEIADATCQYLEQRGIKCWIAPRNVSAGSYASAIVEAIENSKLIVLIFTNSANFSNHVKRELELAVSNGIMIQPFRIEAVEPTPELKYYISSMHWLDAMSPPLEDHLFKLAKIISNIVNSEGINLRS